jgi:hypothetical protein
LISSKQFFHTIVRGTAKLTVIAGQRCPWWRCRCRGSFQKKKILKTREFIENFHFKERYTVKLDEFHRLEVIALV